jgi:hypothetical protein
MQSSLRVGIVLALAVVLVAALALFGCTDSEPADSDAGDNGSSTPAPVAGTQPVLMLGRSVMEAWFAYMDPEWDWESPIVRDGYSLMYGSMETPPDIARSACAFIRNADPDTVVFFKFCFDDFWGGSGSEGREELDNLIGWAEEVAECAADRGLILIVGNALPKVASYTEPDLIAQHRAYNEWLEGFAAGRPGEVYVFDLYGPLTGADGTLKREFSLERDDSHLNSTAYDLLTPRLLELLGRVSESL